jgi:SAM-dependent methyltransferase
MASHVTPGATCPCCGSTAAAPFYRTSDIPVQSNLLATTRDEALALPRGELALAFCHACGFITNTAFDPASQELTAKYEATQGFSATFNTFARSLAERWARQYLRPGQTALEIGCLLGEFTQLLHEASGGKCRAIGIDPVLPAASPPGAPVTLIPDYYSEKYADLPADLIVCRHTLEHIPDAGGFVRMIRRAIGTRDETVVAIEVPDTLRVLREGAFWDLYYEHCSYFTPGSLARLFRASGFDLIDVRREFDDQYLILEARPSTRPTPPRFDLEDDLAAVTEAVAGFPAASERLISRWRRVIDETISEGKRVALWGSGSKAVGFLSTLGIADDRVPYVVDINPRKQGTFLPGTAQRIVGADAMRDFRPDVVIVMNPVYRDEIRRDLDARGLKPDVVAL